MKFFLSKKHVLRSPKSTKKYSRKHSSYRSAIDFVQNFGHVQINILIYTIDIYSLQTKIVSFPDQVKLLKEVDND